MAKTTLSFEYEISDQTENPYCICTLQADLGIEIHGVSSSAKPLCGWVTRDAIQECRESCGGHGYLKGTFLNIHFMPKKRH